MEQKKLAAEALDINSQNKERLKVVRQDRINVEDLECYLEFGHTKYKILNVSPFGLLIQFEKEFLTEDIDANLVVNDVDLGPLRLRKARQENDAIGRQLVGLEIVGEPISVDRVLAIRDSTKLIGEQESYQSSTRRIPDAFARKVYEIKDWLEELQRKVNEFERSKSKSERFSYADYESAFVQVFGNYLNQLMPARNQELGSLIRDFNAEVIKGCYEFFRAKLQELIYQAPFANRVYSKPLGYAGDYEMMNIIYRDDAAGDTLFAKCLHNYWVRQPAAQAVRNRADFIKAKIETTFASNPQVKLRLLSVACGPAMEWQRLISEGAHSNREVDVDLLDQDESALKHAQRRLRELSIRTSNKFSFNLIDKSIKKVIARGLDSKYDLIYSAGLFDYFSDAVAQLAAAKLFEALKPGGKLIIGNFNVENPNSIMMDLALDWHLIYRTKEDFMRMFESLGGRVEVESEPLGINLFCTVSKL